MRESCVMLHRRNIDTTVDRETLLEFHCRGNYESETPLGRTVSYEQYRAKWLSTSQPKEFLSALARSMTDKRTIAEIWEDDGVAVGYVWAAFNDLRGYDLTIVEVNDIAVSSEHQRRGIGTKLLEHVEQMARERGAHLLRSETGIENISSQRLHEKFAFKVYRVQYEKLLVDEMPWTKSSK